MVYLKSIALWFVLGAAFGLAFGAFASVFRGGPEALAGALESWWWFAAAGALVGFGRAQTQILDGRRASA